MTDNWLQDCRVICCHCVTQWPVYILVKQRQQQSLGEYLHNAVESKTELPQSSQAIQLLNYTKLCGLKTARQTSHESFKKTATFLKQFTVAITKYTRSSTTAKSTAHPWCLVGVLYDIYRRQQINSKSTTCMKLAKKPAKFREIMQNNGHYAVPGHSRSPILVPIESLYTTSY